MPRFPVLPQRTSAPAAFSNTPRAQAAHFGAGIGRKLAGLGTEAVELGQEIEQRQKRQLDQRISLFDRELAKRRVESDLQVPPGEASESRIERYGSIFDSSADAVLKEFEGQSLQGRLSEGIAARRETWMKGLFEREAQQRLRRSLEDTRVLVEDWSERVAKDPSEFASAAQELLGDAARGEAGLLDGLGLRPEALAGWREHTLTQLLNARLQSDPAGLLAELETERWQEILPEGRRRSLIEDAQEIQRFKRSVEAIDLGQQRAVKAQQLAAEIGANRAGRAEIRRAEEEGSVSAPQAEALRVEAERAEIARQAQQVAGNELALAMSSGIGFDLENLQNRQAADAFYEKTYSQALREGAPEEVVAQVVSMLAKTGYLPPRLAQDATGLLHSDDGEELRAGAELYGDLRAAAPFIASLAFDPETRARGGILNRWLDTGLEPAEALRRAEAEWPVDGRVQLLEPDELSALKRDLGALFHEDHTGYRADQILDQLEQNYLEDLGKGLTPRRARRQLQRDAGRVIRKLTLMRERAVDATSRAPQFSGDAQSPLLVPIGVVSDAAKAASRGRPKQPTTPHDWRYGPFGNPLEDELAGAAAKELERVTRDVAIWMLETYYFSKFGARPWTGPSESTEAFNGPSVLSGNGESYPSKIVSEKDRGRARTLMFEHPTLGDVTIRQIYDITTEQFYSQEAGFVDPATGDYVFEKLPSSRLEIKVEGSGEAEPSLWEGFAGEVAGAEAIPAEQEQATVIPSDEHRPIVQPGPSADPVPLLPLPPSEEGPGQELIPKHTGGNQTDVGPLSEQVPGFPAQEQEPLIFVHPDLSDDPRFPSVLFAVNAAKDKYAAQIGKKLKEAFDDIETQTGIPVSRKQRRLLIQELKTRSFWERLSTEENAELRKEYTKSINEIISEWETETEQNWPTYQKEVEENGKKVMKTFKYQVHHIIPLSVDGPPTKWWNVHPARFPDQHQAGLHRSGGPLNELTK